MNTERTCRQSRSWPSSSTLRRTAFPDSQPGGKGSENDMDLRDSMTRDPDSNWWAVWFRWALWLGIFQDFVLGFPAVFWPSETLRFLGQTPAPEPAYVSFAAVVLLVLGAMYIPAAINPYRHPLVAWLSALARPPGIVFFLWLYPGVYPVFGVVDSVLSALQVPLLLLTFFAAPLTPFRRSGGAT